MRGGAPLAARNGLVLGAQVSFVDVTHATRLNQELRHANHELEAAYEELLQEYDVEPARLRADVGEFIDQLLEQKLIETGPVTEAGHQSA